MKQEEQTLEDARKCGDLLLVAEAMLEIVNEHNRETIDTFPPLGVRIGALCFALLHLLRARWCTCCVRAYECVRLCCATHTCALLRVGALVACALLHLLRARLRMRAPLK